ncbi:hypothetical protein [Coleofasciculus sp. FACHB-1120]|uniref:hypothetical protein n=1 Tax=Coleofasciculus sp. FACHB-1120 TaxID=2692783 RepID=UPI001F5570B1|nr:hypothetical protein [Coleofasciculus sp. FACHB-1120]
MINHDRLYSKNCLPIVSGFVDTYLQLNAVEEIFQAEIAKFEPAQQEVVMEIITNWMQQGIERRL